MLQVGHPGGLCNRLDVITTGYVLAGRRGEEEIDVFWPLDDRHMPVSFHDLFTGLPRGRVVECNIDPRVLQDYYAMAAPLPSNYRDSQFYGERLKRVLANVVPEVQSEVLAFAKEHFHGSQGPGATTVGIHIR